MRAEETDWLVVIDMHYAFAAPASPWSISSFSAVQARIASLLPLFDRRVMFTRFVPWAVIKGSWEAYYRKWPFATTPDAAAMWTLAEPWQDRPSLDSHWFSKWGTELHRMTEQTDSIVVCGVSTRVLHAGDSARRSR
jgi:hypothetical protein